MKGHKGISFRGDPGPRGPPGPPGKPVVPLDFSKSLEKTELKGEKGEIVSNQ